MSGKLHGNRGETVVEVLAAVLICALSVALLFGSVMASVHIIETAEKTDERFYEGLSRAEEQTAPPLDSGSVELVLKSAPPPDPQPARTVDVDIFGESGLFSYAGKAGAGP